MDRSIVDGLLEERRDAADPADGSTDLVAARRLLVKAGRALARVTDARQRRQRAYALLARNGFDPETCREASRELADDAEDAEPLG